jgi:hypothetical protein
VYIGSLCIYRVYKLTKFIKISEKIIQVLVPFFRAKLTKAVLTELFINNQEVTDACYHHLPAFIEHARWANTKVELLLMFLPLTLIKLLPSFHLFGTSKFTLKIEKNASNRTKTLTTAVSFHTFPFLFTCH